MISLVVLEIKGNAVQEQHISIAEIYYFMLEKLPYIVPSYSSSKMTEEVNKTLIFVPLAHFNKFSFLNSFS